MNFTRFFLLFFFVIWGCDQNPTSQRVLPIQQPANPNTPAQNTNQNTNTAEMAGIMNIKNNSIYKSILESAGICQSRGLVGGTLRCSSWLGAPALSITFNQDFSKVKKAVLTPVGSKFFSRGAPAQPITFQPSNENVTPINAGDGWEIRLTSIQAAYLDIQLRCEYCDIDRKEFTNIDVYKGTDRSIKIGVIPTMAPLPSQAQN